MNYSFRVLRLIPLMLLLLAWAGPGIAAENSPTNAPAGRSEEENLRASLQVQEQLHAMQLAIERTRKENEEAAAANAKMLSDRLHDMQLIFGSQRSRELDVMQSSNKVMVVAAALFSTIGIAAMVFMVYFQSRAISRLVEISAALPATRALLGPASVGPSLGSGDMRLVNLGPSEPSSTPLLGALERLEKRIHELEHATHSPLKAGATVEVSAEPPAHGPNGGGAPSPNGQTDAQAPNSTSAEALLEKGQELLNREKAEEALACFEQALEAAPSHPEALVKKGTALEKLRKLDSAIECYDLAIAADKTLTIAYLHKGGLFNRMERFSEALECYEQALRTQEKRAA
jgi:tetratricopeptide (TPR) repeat protein